MSLPDSLPDAEAQCRQLADLIRPFLPNNPALVGIYSGGVWIAERLKALLDLPEELGAVSAAGPNRCPQNRRGKAGKPPSRRLVAIS